jgi:glycosyltransferase involved in cell wall biosynthesis
MGEAGRARVREHFSWPAVTDATLAAYDEALR